MWLDVAQVRWGTPGLRTQDQVRNTLWASRGRPQTPGCGRLSSRTWGSRIYVRRRSASSCWTAGHCKVGARARSRSPSCRTRPGRRRDPRVWRAATSCSNRSRWTGTSGCSRRPASSVPGTPPLSPAGTAAPAAPEASSPAAAAAQPWPCAGGTWWMKQNEYHCRWYGRPTHTVPSWII